ncbi:MAG: DUF167 domain-containing protein [Planctomycetales bacterium]|nr:DUF167 domain-containing protein [Planctomycetales bacterium]
MFKLETTTDGGIIIPVRAHAGARKNQISGWQDGMLKISVTQQPERGKANVALAALLAKELGVAKSNITLISGPTNSHKRFLVYGADADATILAQYK